MIIRICLFICIFKFSLSFESNLQGFDDTILYAVNWPGALFGGPTEGTDNGIVYEELVVQTEAHEKYMCLIPKVSQKEKDVNDKYTGPNPLDLLSELFTQYSCSYRLETYWTYELCHGKYIRQYHEEREGKKANMQEYFLGRWDKASEEKLRKILQEEEANRPTHPVPVKKIDGINMPYLQVNMSDGTLCDLSSKNRVTNVLYVCYPLGKHEIYTLKETSICEYEVIVLSPLLCNHLRYRPQSSGENLINCIPLENADVKPKSLRQMEIESMELRHQNLVDNLMAVVSFQENPGEGVPRVRLELLPLNEGQIGGNDVDESPAITPVPLEQNTPLENAAFNNFVAGRDCIQGGSGWWKYEFCFGRSVTQFHIERDGSKTEMVLGNFIKSGHLKWLAANPHKRPVPGSHLSYFYTKGTMCEELGQPRQTEVKLKCVENKNSPGAVSLYLLEPRTCQYILGVESNLICRLLQQVDADGLPITEDGLGFSRADYNSEYKEPAKGPDSKPKIRDFKIRVVLDDEGNHIADGDE